jgi:hypothetical protein
MFKHSETVNFSKLFDYAFHSFPKTICESEFDSDDPKGFRLLKRNVLNDWFSNSVHISPAVRDDVVIPDFGDYLTYPFVGITGFSPKSGKYAKTGHEGKYSKDAKASQSSEIKTAIKVVLERNPTAIKPGSVIFKPNRPLNSATYNTITGRDTKVTNDYRHITDEDYLLDQQVLSIDGKGKLFVDENKKSNVVIKKVNGGWCILKKLSDCIYTFGDKMKISDRGVLNFFDEWVKPYLNTSHSYETSYGNENYFKYDDYFRKNGCEVDGKIDVVKAKDFVLSMTPTEFIRDVIWGIWLMSPIEKTYVWVSASINKSFTKEDANVANALSSDAAYNIAIKDDGKNDSTEETVNESKSPIETDENGDVVADTFKDAFFNSMVHAANKVGKSESYITFISDRKNNGKIIKGSITSQKSGIYRVFIKTNEVSDSDPIDFNPIFKDSQFEGILDMDAVKKFIHREISGDFKAFPVNMELERERRNDKDEARNSNRHDIGSTSEFFDKYNSETEDRYVNSGAFHVSVLIPEGKMSEAYEYFLCTGYEESPTQNPIANKDSYTLTDSLKQSIEKVKASTTKLYSAFWYNSDTEADNDRVVMPLRGRGSKKDDSGLAVDYV